MPKFMLAEDIQETNELRYLACHLDKRIQSEIHADPELMAKVHDGAKLLETWLAGTYYPSKNQRLSQLKEFDLVSLTVKAYVQVAYCLRPESLVSVVSRFAIHLGFDDKVDAIITVAEILAVLCNTDAFHITKESKDAPLMCISALELPAELVSAIDHCRYPLPMVCEPPTITHNYESPYLTFNECQIAGKGNAHAGDICLDVINTQNQTPLSLATDFISSVEEEPSDPFDTVEEQQLWAQFKWESYEIYLLLAKQGNRFWLTHKVDKRGRIYAQGYHVNTMGAPFKKACIELADPELVEGVPKLT